MGGAKLYSEITFEISREINSHYASLFDYFTAHPELARAPLFRRVIMRHLPRHVRENATLRARVGKLPVKVRCAIMASEIASRIVYGGGWKRDLELELRNFVATEFR